MSIVSAIYAEEGEKKRKEWVEILEDAYENKDWTAVIVLLKEMREFYFSE